ncbi:LOW QUALITY PROTEIN: hypothetical protein RJ639_018015, partial [Escallonia herrerae]
RIYKQISSDSSKFKDLEKVQKFLLILDDVWNEKYGKWDVLSRPFQAGALRSTVIVTTRNVSVASIMRSVLDYHLDQLENEEICSILAHHARGWQNFDARPGFKETGEAIVKKCKGLPLAMKSLGGLLRTKGNPNEWKDVLNRKIWDLPTENNDILPALRLSYQHLPSHLKRLFAYCSLFPKDYEFDKHELVLLWMTEGFLRPSETHREMEDVGAESQFQMHYLVNDLARHVVGRVCFRLDDKAKNNVQHSRDSLLKARHSSFIHHEYDGSQRFEAFSRVRKLRTFLPLPVFKTHSWEVFYLTNQVVYDLLLQLHFLRVLSLSGYIILQLPNALKNLRHFDILTFLTLELNSYLNLLTLLLRDCRSLTELPVNTGYLINLRHLDITGTETLKEMPVGLCKMGSLQTLSKIFIGRGLKLWDLSNLKGVFSIIGLQCVMDAQDARKANLMRKQGLEELEMVWSSDFDDSRDKMIEKDIIEFLKPSTNLRRLKVKHYGGVEFPSWLGDPSFSQLRTYCSVTVDIVRIKGVKTVGNEFCGLGWPHVGDAFPSLETLEFVDMVSWEEWSTNLSEDDGNFRQMFPRLRELIIVGCPNLISIFTSEASVDPSPENKSMPGSASDTYGLVSLVGEEGQELPPNLEKLVIEKYDKLEKLPNRLKSLKSLRSLSIKECPILVILSTSPEEEVQRNINDGKAEDIKIEPLSLKTWQFLVLRLWQPFH